MLFHIRLKIFNFPFNFAEILEKSTLSTLKGKATTPTKLKHSKKNHTQVKKLTKYLIYYYLKRPVTPLKTNEVTPLKTTEKHNSRNDVLTLQNKTSSKIALKDETKFS